MFDLSFFRLLNKQETSKPLVWLFKYLDLRIVEIVHANHTVLFGKLRSVLDFCADKYEIWGYICVGYTLNIYGANDRPELNIYSSKTLKSNILNESSKFV